MNLDDRDFLRDLGQRLRQHRLDRKWTQAELARRCELHRTFVGSVERGERTVSILNLRLLAKVLRVPLSDLFAGPP
jgi:transcriptional regulator with XRE-family HTH domain